MASIYDRTENLSSLKKKAPVRMTGAKDKKKSY
jgi:hypothetical protein